MLFLFVDLTLTPHLFNVSERQGSNKQLNVAIGMVRKQSYYLSMAEKSTSYGCGL